MPVKGVETVGIVRLQTYYNATLETEVQQQLLFKDHIVYIAN